MFTRSTLLLLPLTVALAGCHDEREFQCTAYGGGPNEQGTYSPGTGQIAIVNTTKNKITTAPGTIIQVELSGGTSSVARPNIKIPVELSPLGGNGNASYVTIAKFPGTWNECHFLRYSEDGFVIFS